VGAVLGELWDQALQPILSVHPDLAPPGLEPPSA
jgi:hypothetical protein